MLVVLSFIVWIRSCLKIILSVRCEWIGSFFLERGGGWVEEGWAVFLVLVVVVVFGGVDRDNFFLFSKLIFIKVMFVVEVISYLF